MNDFIIFSVINVKIYSLLADYDGNVVCSNHMYAAIQCIVMGIMTHFDESSKKYRSKFQLSLIGTPQLLGQCIAPSLFFRVPIFCQKKSHLAFCLKNPNLMNTTSSDKYNVVRRIDIIIFVQEKKPLKLLHFCFGNTGVPIYKKIGNFFFNMKIHQ